MQRHTLVVLLKIRQPGQRLVTTATDLGLDDLEGISSRNSLVLRSQHLIQEINDLRRIGVTGWRRILTTDDSQLVEVLEGLLHEQQSVENATESPDINLLINVRNTKEINELRSTIHLGGGLGDIVLHLLHHGLVLELNAALLAGTEIDELPGVVLGEKDVLQLEIAVGDGGLLLVKEDEGGGDIVHQFPNGRLGNLLLFLLHLLEDGDEGVGAVLHEDTVLPTTEDLLLLKTIDGSNGRNIANKSENIELVIHHLLELVGLEIENRDRKEIPCIPYA